MSEANARLNDIGPLKRGKHNNFSDGACVMEAVSYIAGEPWSDHPACACPVITAFLVNWNDALPDDERDTLLRPLILRVVGTRGDTELGQRRVMMAVDWLVRVHTPAWLRLAKLDAAASALEGLPEITDMEQYPSLLGPLRAARKDANAAIDTAAAVNAAWAFDAAVDTAAAVDAAVDATWAAAYAGAAVRDAARAAVRAAAASTAAAIDALKPTRLRLQQSAVDLVGRMIEAKPHVG